MFKTFQQRVLLILIVLLPCLPSLKSYAYLSSIQVVEKKEIVRLKDEELTENYIDVDIEIQAIFASHVVQVFSPKEYQQYKDLIRYRYELKSELQRRQLEVPMIETNPRFP